MMVGQKVEIEHKGNIANGRITKVINKNSCVVSWQEGKNFKYSVLFLKQEVEKGRARYESAIAK